MPHKHTRKRKPNEEALYDLPPSTVAKSLSVANKTAQKSANGPNNSKRKKVREKKVDDTPKEFTRLLNIASRRSGSGKNVPENERKRKVEVIALHDESARPSKSVKTDSKTANKPRILPGEKLSDFSARVDQSMPVAGFSRKGKSQGLVKDRKTRIEKKIQKMQERWREEEAKRKEAEEEARDLAEQDELENWKGPGSLNMRQGKNVRGSHNLHDPGDPWAGLRQAREAPPRLNDVAQAPPSFTQVPKEKFKVRNGAKVDVANVPATSGSLRKREKIGQERKSIIDSYRKLMESKRDNG